MKTTLICGKAHIHLNPNSPGDLFHILNNTHGIKAFCQEIKKIEQNSRVASMHATYKQIVEGLWYIKSKYEFHYDSEINISVDDAEPYYEIEYFVMEKGQLAFDNAGTALKNQMMFSNSSKSLTWYTKKATCLSSYKFLLTKKFIQNNFNVLDADLEASMAGGVINFNNSLFRRTISDEEKEVLKTLDNLPEQDTEKFLYTIAARSCCIQLLHLFFHSQLARSAATTNGEVFTKPLGLMQDCICKEFPGTEKLAAAANMSVSSFKRKFREHFDTTPESYFRKLQMDAAEKNLKSSSVNIKAIAHQFGFANAQNFRNTFKKVKGYAPGATI